MKSHSARTITVVDYDPAWPAQLEYLKSHILRVVGDAAISVEHIGSTSVPGLAAKPIIDIDIVVTSDTDVTAVIGRLAALGYTHRGTLGIEGRETFESPPGLPANHLYVCTLGSIALENHLAVRDYLRRHADAVAAYGILKKRLAAQFPSDAERYVDGKTNFLLAALRTAGFPDHVLAAISLSNQIKA